MEGGKEGGKETSTALAAVATTTGLGQGRPVTTSSNSSNNNSSSSNNNNDRSNSWSAPPSFSPPTSRLARWSTPMPQ
eukprot:evm.model.NODE_10003_length_20220_cov_27.836004.5